MTVGVVLQYYESRNDVRWMLEELGERADVVVFTSEGEASRVSSRYQVRTFRPAPRDYWSALWGRIFRWFGRIPRSRDNYYITELAKTSWLPEEEQLAAQRRLRWRMSMPDFMRYDFLLDRVRRRDRTPIYGIDAFLFITEVTNTFFLARALASGKPVGAYVYSWDHPCKHVSISRRCSQYFVWNHGIAEDLVTLHNVPSSRISSTGATQLAPLYEYLHQPRATAPPYPFPYVYFGCAIGYGSLAKQEVRIVALVSRLLAEVAPKVKLVVRPYPFLKDWSLYEPLTTLENVVLDSQYRDSGRDPARDKEDSFDKLAKLEHAKGFLHLGSTMGLECAYLDTPSILLNLTDFDYGVAQTNPYHVRSFMGQYHLRKYLALEGHANYVTSARDLRTILAETSVNPTRLLPYNRVVRESTPLRKMTAIVEDWVSALDALRTDPFGTACQEGLLHHGGDRAPKRRQRRVS